MRWKAGRRNILLTSIKLEVKKESPTTQSITRRKNELTVLALKFILYLGLLSSLSTTSSCDSQVSSENLAAFHRVRAFDVLCFPSSSTHRIAVRSCLQVRSRVLPNNMILLQ